MKPGHWIAATGAAALLAGAGLLLAHAQVATASAPRAVGDPAPHMLRGTVSGRVTLPDGRPAAGYTVEALIPNAYGNAMWMPVPVRVKTDSEGRYLVPLDPPAPRVLVSGLFLREPQRITLTVRTPGKPYLEPAPRRIDAREGIVNRIVDVDFVLQFGPEITVHVRDAQTHEPVPGMIVKYGPELYGSASLIAGATDANGDLTFHSGTLDTRLAIDEPVNPRIPVRAAPGYTFSHRITLQSPKAATWNVKTYRMDGDAPSKPTPVTGVVLSPGGRPVEGALVRIRDRDWHDSATVRTDRDGRFSVLTQRLDFYDSGRKPWTVFVTAGGLSARYQPTPDETWDGMTIRLQQGRLAAITGSVVDANGQPIAGVQVTVLEGHAATHYTDTAGRFRFDGLDPDERYRLQISDSKGGAMILVPSQPPGKFDALAVAAGGTTDVGRILLPQADKVVAGTVTDENGRPFPGILNINVHGEHTQKTAETDADGRFRVTRVVDEPLTLTAVFPTDPDPTHPHGFSWGPGDKNVAREMPVRAGDENVAVRSTRAAWEAARASAPPPPIPPSSPVVYPYDFPRAILGLGLTALPDRTSLVDSDGVTVWQGRLTDLDGVRLEVRDNRGTLKDASGKTRWSGAVAFLPETFVETTVPLKSSGQEPHVIVRDRSGTTLWEGSPRDPRYIEILRQRRNPNAVGAAARFAGMTAVANSLRVQLPDGSWQTAGRRPPVARQDSVRFGAVSGRGVLTDAAGKTLWSGPMQGLTVSRTPKDLGMPFVGDVILPYGLNGVPRGFDGRLTLYDAQGKPVPGGFVQYGTKPQAAMAAGPTR